MGNPLSKKIIIIDDHPLVRKGLVETLESEQGLEVVAELERAEETELAVKKYQPDLLLVDISLPGMNGIELVKNLIFQNSDQKILVISRHEESLYAERALRAGAKGYIMKFESCDTLIKAVRKVLNGGIYVSEDISEKLLMNAMSGKKNAFETPVDILSDRELEVYELIGKGKSNNEIAEQLHLAVKTIETYRSRIKDKMNFKNSTALVFHAVKWVENESEV
jgi:DNA-binding NarL/FixJ family response regulator